MVAAAMPLPSAALAQQAAVAAAETEPPYRDHRYRVADRCSECGEHESDQVLSSQYIETSGKTDISDLILQLPQIFNNSLGRISATRPAA